MRKVSVEDQARTDATKAANAAHAGKSDAERSADTRAVNAAHAGKSDKERTAETHATNKSVSAVRDQSAVASPVTSTPSSGNPSTKGGSSWTKIETVVAGDDFYGCTRVFKAPEAGKSFVVSTPVNDWSDGKSSSGSVTPSEPKTFFVSAADAGGVNQVKITAGAINSVPNAGGTITVTDGMQIYLDVTWDTDGVTVTDVVIGTGTLPSNTATESYTLLASIAITGGNTVVTPYAWNYSQAQACGTIGTSITVTYW